MFRGQLTMLTVSKPKPAFLRLLNRKGATDRKDLTRGINDYAIAN